MLVGNLKNIQKIANKILDKEKEYKNFTELQLKNKTNEFIENLKNGYTLDDILVDVFCTCREATYRVLGKRQYLVQIMAGVALHQGRIIEMKTGEGKTLTELCPAYLNSLISKGVYILTVNSYLTTRDFSEMNSVFEYLNRSVGLVTETNDNKKENYAKDITYSTHTELGFDYLKDNTAIDKNNKTGMRFNFVIIDEVDSVLIDEALTPLILAVPNEQDTNLYNEINYYVNLLVEDDYEIDLSTKSIYLNGVGSEKLENLLGVDLLDPDNCEYQHIINQSLKANFLFKKEIDYIVDDDEVVLIDIGTGRLAQGRRFGEGLHQAIEAKEGVSVKAESITAASITFQNFFKLFNKVSGMSGTVSTEKTEFEEIYNLDIIEIPTNKPIKRRDLKDKLFYDKHSKYEAIINDIKDINKTGQPILVGTQSIEDAQMISSLLDMKNIKYNLLTAKDERIEAEIISRAGEEWSITVATNIAGRGTDIKISQECLDVGLAVLVTEHAYSERIDNQLIGRSGRQGNIGFSQFYVSIEDTLFEEYPTDFMKKFIENNKNNKGTLANTKIEKQIKLSQNLACGSLYSARKDTVKFDEVLNIQRELIYKQRNFLLELNNETEKNEILYLVSKLILNRVQDISKQLIDKDDHDSILITNCDVEYFEGIFSIALDRLLNETEHFNDTYSVNKIDFEEALTNLIIEKINSNLNDITLEEFSENVARYLLSAIDLNWSSHLNTMEVLKIVVKDQNYNQRKPEDIYKYKALESFNKMIENINKSFLKGFFTE